MADPGGGGLGHPFVDFEVVFSLGEVTCTTASTRSRNYLNAMRDDLNYLRGGGNTFI